MRGWFVTGSALFLCALVACGGSASVHSSDGGAVRGSDGGISDGDAVMVACGRWDDVFTKLDGCKGFGYESATDRTLFLASCADIVNAPGSGLTVAFLNGCADAANRDPDLCTNWDQLTACARPLGTRPGGAPCGSVFQCASGNCDVGENTQCGACVALGNIGEACDNGGCAAGLECFNFVCFQVQTLARGAACSYQMVPGDHCATGLTCIVGSGATTGTCEPVPTVGQACEGFCAGHATCLDNICAAIVGSASHARPTTARRLFIATRPSTARAAPPSSAPPPAPHAIRLSAAWTSTATRNALVCRPYATTGQPCSDADDIRCDKALDCISGVCVVRDPGQCG